jgi:hypothetical protein
MALTRRLLTELVIDDEPSFKHIALYAKLKAALIADNATFRVPDAPLSWDRAVFLNLTYWSADAGGDVLMDDHVPADVVMHVAWHTVARKHLVDDTSAEAMFLGESIASAFDLYLVGRVLGHAKDSAFLETQVPALGDRAAAAGLDEDGFEALLTRVGEDPEAAFEDLRALLFDVMRDLVTATSLEAAEACLAARDSHWLAPLLHHYELSNWALYARAYAKPSQKPIALAIDTSLKSAKCSLDWLEREWLSAY